MTVQLNHGIQGLKKKILSLSASVENAIGKSISSLIYRDIEQAESVISEDTLIDHFEVEIEEDCLKLLALQQPVARDLRFVVAILKMNEALERMGDLAVSIAKRSIFLSRYRRFDLLDEISEMASKAQQMVKNAIDALVTSDTSLANRVCQQDDDLDKIRKAMNTKIYREIREHPDDLEGLMAVYSIVRHIERLGDMATIIAQDVIYMVDGSIIRHGHHTKLVNMTDPKITYLGEPSMTPESNDFSCYKIVGK